MGWLRFNGRRRWIKVGGRSLQVWTSEQDEEWAEEYTWGEHGAWMVSELFIDLDRDDPALKATLSERMRHLAAPDPATQAHVTVVLEAYKKASEPTREERLVSARARA